MTAKAELVNTIERQIRARHWSHKRAADRLGLTSARLDELLAGDMDRFTIKDLIAIGITVGVELHVA